MARQMGKDIAAVDVTVREPLAVDLDRLQEWVEDSASGDVKYDLGSFMPGDRVSKADMSISGKAYYGRLSNLQDVVVTVNSVVYPNKDAPTTPAIGEKTFVIDFGTMTTLYALSLKGNGLITLVLPWLGTAFSPTPLYPLPTTVVTSVPSPVQTDKNGAEVVSFSGIDTTKLLVQVRPKKKLMSTDNFSAACLLRTGTAPENISASVGDRQPFWTHPGRLTEQVPITGLTDELNIFLQNITKQSQAVVNFSCSNGGVIKVAFDRSNDFVTEKSIQAHWGGETSTDIELTAGKETSLDLHFPVQTSGRVKGVECKLALEANIPKWRASDEDDGQALAAGLKVSSSFSVACPFSMKEKGSLHGLALPFLLPLKKGELRLEIRKDSKGRPSLDGDPVVSVVVVLTEKKGTGVNWQEVLFDTPQLLLKNTRFWLVAKGKSGESQWAGRFIDSNTGSLFSVDGGKWRSYPAVKQGKNTIAAVRLLREPFAREDDAEVTISFSGGEEHDLRFDQDEKADLVVASPLGTGRKRADGEGYIILRTVLKPLVSATMTIKKATLFYREN